MQITTTKADLARELHLLQSVTDRKKLAILENVLLTMAGDGLTLVATDLEVAIRCRLADASGTPGSTTIPGTKLYEIVRALPEGEVVIEADDKKATVRGGSFRSQMPTMATVDFPIMPPVDALPETISAAALKSLVGRVKFAVTQQDTRYYLNGALLIGTIGMVATDGHRLALAQVGEVDGQPSVIVPAKTLAELAKLLDKEDSDVEVRRSDRHISFTFKNGTRELISQLVDGKFPAWDRVIPKGNDKRATIERTPFQRAVARVALVTKQSIRMEFAAGKCMLSASSPEYGEAREEIAIDYSSPDIAINLNPRYVEDFLSVVESDLIYFEAKTPESQVTMSPVGETDKAYTYVLMPMRL